jgi:predicted RecA/RadA family phage recombinase
MNNLIHEGDLVPWTNGTGSDVSSGDIVAIDGILYVATGDIANTASGVLATNVAVKAAAVDGAAISAGQSVIWDVSVSKFDDNAATPATGDISGAAARAIAASNDTTDTVEVKLTGVKGTVA